MVEKAEKMLLDALRQSLHLSGNKMHDGQYVNEENKQITEPGNEQDVSRMFEIAKKHAVLPLLFDVYEDDKDLPALLRQELQQSATITVRSNYRLLFLSKYITQVLESYGIRAILLKGASTASCYPVPELRKSGDVDILIPKEDDFRRAVEVLKKEGFAESEEQFALHHTEMKNSEGISVEIHRILAEPFESKKMNHYLETLLPEYDAHVISNNLWGVTIYQPEDAYHAFYLILHMLQHFLRAGFGLKFLCDWTVFWEREVAKEEKETFLRLIKESGTEGFVTVLTKACVEYLGLREDNVEFLLGDIRENASAHSGKGAKDVKEADFQNQVEDFMAEVFAGGEFGHDVQQRMVAMRGTGITAYIREFHHQMHLNYPKAGKVFLFWPLLWILTLVRFLYNNRAVRKVKGWDILKEARRRSRLIDRMKLF